MPRHSRESHRRLRPSTDPQTRSNKMTEKEGRGVSISPLNPKTLVEGLERIAEVAITKHNDAALDNCVADDCVFHGPGGDATLDDLKQLWADIRAAFTGFAPTRDAVLVQGNMVAARTRTSDPSTTSTRTAPPAHRAADRRARDSPRSGRNWTISGCSGNWASTCRSARQIRRRLSRARVENTRLETSLCGVFPTSSLSVKGTSVVGRFDYAA